MDYYGIKGTETVEELKKLRDKAYKEMSEAFKKYQKANKNNDRSSSHLGITAEARQTMLFKLDAYIKDRESAK